MGMVPLGYGTTHQQVVRPTENKSLTHRQETRQGLPVHQEFSPELSPSTITFLDYGQLNRCERGPATHLVDQILGP